MINRYIIYAILLLTFAGCSSSKQEEEKEIAKMLKEFCSWHMENAREINGVETVGNPDGDTSKCYRVNFPRVEEYIDSLRKSGFFTEYFLKNIQKEFRKGDSIMVAENQKDGIPQVVGENEDELLCTQEEDLIVNFLMKEKYNLTIKNDTAAMQFDEKHYGIWYLVKTDDKWLILSNGCVN